MARRNGWRIILRIEDLDGPRIKPGVTDQIISTLGWLGIDWDGDPLVQSVDLKPYTDAVTTLAASGAAYPCELTRTQIEAAAGAPQEGSGESRFPASLRPADWNSPRPFSDTGTNWRFATPPEAVGFTDAFAGSQSIRPAETIGDFVLWTKRGTPSYQLAVVVDDARQGVTHVVRGDDLLDSAARQILLYRDLSLQPQIPAYTHLPLVLGVDGRRLAKRHGDTRIDAYRDRGVPAQAVIGLIARWCGLTAAPVPMNAVEFRDRFDLTLVPKSPITFTPKDDAWLFSQA